MCACRQVIITTDLTVRQGLNDRNRGLLIVTGVAPMEWPRKEASEAIAPPRNIKICMHNILLKRQLLSFVGLGDKLLQ